MKDKSQSQFQSNVDITGFTSLPSGPSSMSPGPGTGRSTVSPAPAMMKPSFSQVSEPTSGAGTPVNGNSDRAKVAFGFGTKRKATEEGHGTPPQKRR